MYKKQMIMQDQNNEQSIPTIRQIHNLMKDSYNQLTQTFIDIGVSPLPTSQDLQIKKITINDVLKKIPPEERLENMLNGATKQLIKQKLNQYEGNNSLIKKAKQNFSQIKKQQQKIYYLAAQCQLPSVSPQFQQHSPKNLQHLQSYKNIAEIKKTKIKTLQKNCISQHYLEEGQAEMDNKNQPIIIQSNKKGQQLKKLDLLVHVNFYDSHNSQKQHQFVCTEDLSLSSLVQKFKCLIDSLSSWQKNKNNDEWGNITQKNDLYDKFSQLVPEHTSNKNYKGVRNDNLSLPSLKYLVIQDSIYYEGNRNKLQPLINLALNKDRINYNCYELNKTKISQIRPIFGKPYLYRHLEGCDHIIIFKQARLFMGNDQFNHDIIQVQKYPITIFQSKMKRKKCQGCSEYFCDFVSIGDPLKNGENLYLCINCHQDLHLDEEGNQKYGDKSKLINYIHD